MAKILVTGSKGFIGKNLIDTLKGLGHTVEGMDILDVDSMQSYVSTHLIQDSFDIVFHVGACSDTLETDTNYMMLLNFEATKMIADACTKHGIMLVYSSSAASYGTNNLHPSNLYGWSKYVAEQYVLKCGGIGLRYFNVYGKGEENKGRMASVAYQMYLKNKNQEKISLFPGNPKRDFVYIKDVISANIHAMNFYKTLKGATYDVGFGAANTFEKVLDIMGIEYDYHSESSVPKGYQYYTCANPFAFMPSWVPKYDIETGVKDYLKELNK